MVAKNQQRAEKAKTLCFNCFAAIKRKEFILACFSAHSLMRVPISAQGGKKERKN